jgi:hypothetical protein
MSSVHTNWLLCNALPNLESSADNKACIHAGRQVMNRPRTKRKTPTDTAPPAGGQRTPRAQQATATTSTTPDTGSHRRGTLPALPR